MRERESEREIIDRGSKTNKSNLSLKQDKEKQFLAKEDASNDCLTDASPVGFL
jgi:hypothetical protein